MGIKIISKNKKAYHNYIISDKTEAGLELRGTEVKSLRAGRISINESYVTIDERFEAWIINMKIPPYEFGNIHNHNESRKRKLLLHADQIHKLKHLVMAQRMTIVPTMVYFKGSKVKLEIALGKGKKQYDKRDTESKKESNKSLKNLNFD